MNKNNLNFLFAVVFLIGFIAFWDAFVVSRYAPSRPPAAASPTPPVETEPEKTPPSIKGAHTNSLAAIPSEGGQTVELKTDRTLATFESIGARVSSWRVKEGEHWIELVLPAEHRMVSPLETFPDLRFDIIKKSDREAVFSTRAPNGLKIVKTVLLLSEPPFHNVGLAITNTTKNSIDTELTLGWGNGIDKHTAGTPYDNKEEAGVRAESRAVGYAQQVKSWHTSLIHRLIDLTDATHYEWIGVDNNHFLACLIGDIAGIQVRADRKTPPYAGAFLRETLAPGQTKSVSYLIYAGPKSFGDLKKLGHHLDQAVDFGFFGVIAKFLLASLKFFKGITGNFGWAIILLTFCIQIVVFPLTKKNLQHAARMKDLQPQIKKLQEQFKSDPKRLQVETFNFYRKNGLKFMGMEGCFPMLLQIPIFFAFYSTLRVAYELRGAPWIFWIHDLGTHDPYYILPILMGLGMFLQQKLTAVATDPAQARMMLMMPVIFTFMFLKLPAGLVLYWVVNSLTTIVIQKIIRWRHPTGIVPAT